MTIEGIKKRAKKIKKATPGMTHTVALEAAAKEAGWSSYRNALDNLGPAEPRKRRPLFMVNTYEMVDGAQSTTGTLLALSADTLEEAMEWLPEEFSDRVHVDINYLSDAEVIENYPVYPMKNGEKALEKLKSLLK